ncbi:hypothetical protein PR048_033502 [Dryococelus australis]|uniref:Uncharacterized protein n=1 Tax=Dryococelus australis TaxID=614101 RepID=A0ABQ9G3R4_9NEOP|nr:hypothetical protein PR048_033502 [Dryococelus australis]
MRDIHYLPKSNWAPVHNVCPVVATPLESRRTTSCGYNSSHPVWHALYECLQDIHGDSSSFLLQPFHELRNGFWPRLTSPHPAIQFVPNMLYRVEVGALGGSVQSANIVADLEHSPLTEANPGFDSRRGHFRIFTRGNRAGRCRWPAGVLGDLPSPPPHRPRIPDRHGGITARLARRSDEALGVRVSVARIVPSLLDLELRASAMKLRLWLTFSNRSLVRPLMAIVHAGFQKIQLWRQTDFSGVDEDLVRPFENLSSHQRTPQRDHTGDLYDTIGDRETVCGKMVDSICDVLRGSIIKEVGMEQRRNAKLGEMGEPRDNPPTSGIVRRDSHMRKSGSDPVSIRTRFAQLGGGLQRPCPTYPRRRANGRGRKQWRSARCVRGEGQIDRAQSRAGKATSWPELVDSPTPAVTRPASASPLVRVPGSSENLIPLKVPAYLELFSTFEAEKRRSYKGDTTTRIQCAIAAKRKALNWAFTTMYPTQRVRQDDKAPSEDKLPGFEFRKIYGSFALEKLTSGQTKLDSKTIRLARQSPVRHSVIRLCFRPSAGSNPQQSVVRQSFSVCQLNSATFISLERVPPNSRKWCAPTLTSYLRGGWLTRTTPHCHAVKPFLSHSRGQRFESWSEYANFRFYTVSRDHSRSMLGWSHTTGHRPENFAGSFLDKLELHILACRSLHSRISWVSSHDLPVACGEVLQGKLVLAQCCTHSAHAAETGNQSGAGEKLNVLRPLTRERFGIPYAYKSNVAATALPSKTIPPNSSGGTKSAFRGIVCATGGIACMRVHVFVAGGHGLFTAACSTETRGWHAFRLQRVDNLKRSHATGSCIGLLPPQQRERVGHISRNEQVWTDSESATLSESSSGNSANNIARIRRHDGSTARLARRSDEALGVRVSVARIAPSLLDLGPGLCKGLASCSSRLLMAAPKHPLIPSHYSLFSVVMLRRCYCFDDISFRLSGEIWSGA